MRATLALSLGVCLSLAIILAGCGSSNHAPSSGDPPLQITTQSPLPSGGSMLPIAQASPQPAARRRTPGAPRVHLRAW